MKAKLLVSLLTLAVAFTVVTRSFGNKRGKVVHRSGEGDGTVAIRQGDGAVTIVFCREGGGIGTGRDLDNILRPQGADDRVVAALGAEDDPVGGFEG